MSIREFAARVNPAKFGFSPKLTSIVGAIIGFDYGDGLHHLTITSDGFVTGFVAEISVFIGDVEGMEYTLKIWRDSLSKQDRKKFDVLFKNNVTDWREHAVLPRNR
jgi:hypothetical protein